MVAATESGTDESGGPDEDGAVQVGRKLGFTLGMVVQERGWDEDTDDDPVSPSRTPSTPEMLDEDSDDVADVVVLWWRDDDGDLVDGPDQRDSPLADDGFVWFHPEDRPGRLRRRRRHLGGGLHSRPHADQRRQLRHLVGFASGAT